MTACGWNAITCSLRSVFGSIRSTTGTTNVSPLSAVLWYLPNRCTIATRLWGMILMLLPATRKTTNARIPSTISPVIALLLRSPPARPARSARRYRELGPSRPSRSHPPHTSPGRARTPPFPPARPPPPPRPPPPGRPDPPAPPPHGPLPPGLYGLRHHRARTRDAPVPGVDFPAPQGETGAKRGPADHPAQPR